MHSGLKIPINVDSTSNCSFTSNNKAGKRLKEVSLIFWDEISMQHQHVIGCVDRSLQDLRGVDQLFGGAVVLFSGDFRQILPVVP